jgi:ABC-type multidrug transport system fused ATPase/permease subunit
MFTRIRRLLNQFFSKSRTIDNEPLNKVSLIVIIIIDIFILINVFSGLNDISTWHLNPSQAYPCYYEWNNYQRSNNKDKNYEIISDILLSTPINANSFQQSYLQEQQGHLGKVAPICLQYAEIKDKVRNSQNQQTLKTIEQKQNQISNLEQKNQTIRSQYDSTLLEKISGQPRNQSINAVGAEKAKQELDKNNGQISSLKQEITNLKNQLLTAPESVNLISLLNNGGSSTAMIKGYDQALFWYPIIQFSFQSIFLLPLIVISLSVHNLAQRRRYGLVSLISWHLLVIFCIPLLFKIFEFLQFGVIFQLVFDIISTLVGGLLFLVSYIYILLIPLIGFGIIKFFQTFVFNTKVQAANRVQKLRCVRCAKRIRHDDLHCPHCGYHQYVECPNCHNLTYKHLSHCKHCGHFNGAVNL